MDKKVEDETLALRWAKSEQYYNGLDDSSNRITFVNVARTAEVRKVRA